MGIPKSSGKYIGFVDSDDYVSTKMFEILYQTAEQHQSDMVECHYHYLCEEGKRTKVLRTRGTLRQYRDQKDMFINAQASPCNKLFRREVLLHPGVDFPEGFIYEDTGFYLKTIPYVKNEHFINQQFYYYYLRSSSTMNANKSRKVGNIFPVLEDTLDFYKSNNFYNIYEKELEYFCVKILLCSSLSRIGRIKDAVLAKELYDKTFSFIQENFPRYRNNPYLHGKIGLYLKLVKRGNCTHIGKILGHIMKG
jgi:glycosyltransferase involved in cell wall biosynthesis